MLVKKGDILQIEMVDVSIKVLNKEGQIEEVENNFCVRFHLKNSDGYIDIPCFYTAGFDLGYMPDADKKQLQLTQEFLNSYPDDAYIILNSNLLYGMDVYH